MTPACLPPSRKGSSGNSAHCENRAIPKHWPTGSEVDMNHKDKQTFEAAEVVDHSQYVVVTHTEVIITAVRHLPASLLVSFAFLFSAWRVLEAARHQAQYQTETVPPPPPLTSSMILRHNISFRKPDKGNFAATGLQPFEGKRRERAGARCERTSPRVWSWRSIGEIICRCFVRKIKTARSRHFAHAGSSVYATLLCAYKVRCRDVFISIRRNGERYVYSMECLQGMQEQGGGKAEQT